MDDKTAGVTSSPKENDDVVTSSTQKDDVVAESTPEPNSIDENDISNAVESALETEEEVKEETEEEVVDEEETTDEEEIAVPDFTNKKGKESRFDKTEEYINFVKRKEEKLKEKYEKEYQEKLRLEAEKLAEEKLKEKLPDIEMKDKSVETDYEEIESELKKFAEEETETGAKLIKTVLEISKQKDKQIAELIAKQEQINEKFALEESAKKAVKEADEQEQYNHFFNKFPDAAKEDSIWAKNYNNTINFVMQQKKVSPLEALEIAVKDKINIGYGLIPETVIKSNTSEEVSSKTQKLISGAKQRLERKPQAEGIYDGNKVVSRQEYRDPEEAVLSAMGEFSSLFEDEALRQIS